MKNAKCMLWKMHCSAKKIVNFCQNFGKQIFENLQKKKWRLRSREECKSCRSRKMLQNASSLAIVAVDTEENEPIQNEVWWVRRHFSGPRSPHPDFALPPVRGGSSYGHQKPQPARGWVAWPALGSDLGPPKMTPDPPYLIFNRLVLLCIDSYDSERRRILQHFSRSTRFQKKKIRFAFFSRLKSSKICKH